jgi:twinkle protein
VWVVAHPTKLKKLDNGGYPPPTPYDISGSAHWRNKPDNCITVYRDMESNDVDVHIQKVRFKEIGKIGKATLRYDVATGCYQ